MRAYDLRHDHQAPARCSEEESTRCQSLWPKGKPEGIACSLHSHSGRSAYGISKKKVDQIKVEHHPTHQAQMGKASALRPGVYGACPDGNSRSF